MDPVSKQIGRYQYDVLPLGGREGSRVLARITSTVIPALESASTLDLVHVLIAVAKALTPAELDFLVAKFSPLTFVVKGDNVRPRLSDVFDDHFAREYLEMAEWIAFCLEVNYGPFFDGLKAKIPKKRSASAASPTAAGESSSSSATTSTGASGAS